MKVRRRFSQSTSGLCAESHGEAEDQRFVRGVNDVEDDAFGVAGHAKIQRNGFVLDRTGRELSPVNDFHRQGQGLGKNRDLMDSSERFCDGLGGCPHTAADKAGQGERETTRRMT